MPVRNSRAFKRDAYPEDLLGALVFLASTRQRFRHRPVAGGGRRLGQ